MHSNDVGGFVPERSAIQVDAGVWLLDLGFQGRGEVIAAYLLADERGELALIETGPSSTLLALREGIRRAGFAPERLTKLLVTHIHLDHAGAAGPLARLNPDLKVYVHPAGAPHLIDPGKLLASAGRIYGDRMEPLWGEVAPIPENQVVPLTDGETLTVCRRRLEVLFTPGHASHHVAFWDEEAGAAFTGDVGGVRMPRTGYVCPPAPPPDLDPAAWHESIARLRALGARRWYTTHYGPFDDADAHLDQLEFNLDEFLRIGFDALDRGADQTELTVLFHDHMSARLGDVPAGILTNLEWATPSYMAALGIARLHGKTGRRAGGQDGQGG